MAVEHRPGRVVGKPWFSTEAGQYHDSREAAEHYDRLELMKRTPPAGSALDRIKTPDLRTHIEGRIASAAFDQAIAESEPAAHIFVYRNPWYVDSDANKLAIFNEMKQQIHERRLMPPFTYDDYLRIATELREAGCLQVNQQALKLAESAKLANEIAHRKEYTEQELYNMPLEKLERLQRGLPVEG